MADLESMALELAIFVPAGVLAIALLGMFGLLRPALLREAPLRRVGLRGLDLIIAVNLLLLGMVAAWSVISAMGLAGTNLTAMQHALRSLMSQAISHGPTVVYLLYRAAQQSDGLRELGVARRVTLRDVLRGVLGIAALMPIVAACNALVVVGGKLLFNAEPPMVGHQMLLVMKDALSEPAALALLITSAVVVAPITEELIFRGFVQTALLEDVVGPSRRWTMLLLSAGIFTGVHVGLPPQVLPGLFILGVGLGWLYERTGSIWPSIVAHAIFNAVNTIIVLLSG